MHLQPASDFVGP